MRNLFWQPPILVQNDKTLKCDAPNCGSNNNIHNLRLIEALVQAGASDRVDCIATLYDLGLAQKLAAVLDYAVANQVRITDSMSRVHAFGRIFCR